MKKTNQAIVLLACVLITVSLVLIKYVFTDLAYVSSGFVLVILLTLFLTRNVYTYFFGLLAMANAIVPFFLIKIPVLSSQFVQQFLTGALSVLAVFIVLFIKKAIDKERKQMNALFEFATEGIIVINTEGRIVLVNPEARILFQYEAREMLNKPIEVLISAKYQIAQLSYLMNYLRNPSIFEVERQREFCAVKKNGNDFPVLISLSYFIQFNETFILMFITDNTERKKSENKLKSQNEQLELITKDIKKINTELENKVSERTLILQEALHELERSQHELNDALNKEKELNEIKSRFVSMASHEFRTPLSTILSSASLISKYQVAEDHPKREKHIKRVKDSVKHLTNMLEDFLNLGKLDEGKVIVVVGVFNVNEFLLDIFDELEAHLKYGQHINLSYTGGYLFATDMRLLKNIFLNLLTNAIKFSEVEKLIDVFINNTGSNLELEVRDQGLGISPEDMPHLYSTFFRGRNVTNIQGTGLGLHIVQRYIRMLEGDISISSRLNEGTVIKMRLPALEYPVEAVNEP